MDDAAATLPPAHREANNAGVCVLLCAALLLCYLAVWKGEPLGGYEDVREYFRMSEGLWLRGDMSCVDTPGHGRRYYRYPVGLAVLSGPFVILGHALQNVTHGAIRQRAVIALAIPLLAAASGLLLFLTGRALDCSARACAWAVLLFALGSPILTFVRIYYADMAVVFFMLLAAWSGLHALHSAARAAEEPAAWKWALLAGLGLAGAVGCHYSSIPMAAGLWTVLSGALVAECSPQRTQRRDFGFSIFDFRLHRTGSLNRKSQIKDRELPSAARSASGAVKEVAPASVGRSGTRGRVALVAALSAFPVLAALGLMALNQLRHGNPLRTGYEVTYSSPSILLDANVVRGNGVLLLLFAWRTPWVLLALWGFAGALCGALRELRATSQEPRATSQEPRAKSQELRANGFFCGALLLALAGQALFWLLFRDTCRFPLRYPLPMLSLLAVGLVFAARQIVRRWPQRGLFYAGVLSLCWNAAYFIRGEDVWPSFFLDARFGPGLFCHVWYMAPPPPGDPRRWFTPVGWPQVAILCALLAGGILLLCLAFRKARALDGACAIE